MEFGVNYLYEVADVLKENGGPIPISRAGMYAAIKRKEVPTVKVGKRIFIQGAYIDKILTLQDEPSI